MNSKRHDNRRGNSNGPSFRGNSNRYGNRGNSMELTPSPCRNKSRPDRNVSMDGVYGNPRFAYGVTQLIGCTVRVEVKNGSKYEGVFITFSPQMEIVLQMAIRLDENNSNSQEIPTTKEEIIEAIIFHIGDVVAITAINVDLDYATKDSFTDGAISKHHNGELGVRELQRWDADGPDVDLALESDNANGWSAEDMFKTNAETYNVKTSYDSTLTQYTTSLDAPGDSAEFDARQARAAKLAGEIESTVGYKSHIDLENLDEGEKISAVMREPQLRDQSTTDRYIPPALRKGGGPAHTAKPPPPGHAPPPSQARSYASSLTNSLNINDSSTSSRNSRDNHSQGNSSTATGSSVTGANQTVNGLSPRHRVHGAENERNKKNSALSSAEQQVIDKSSGEHASLPSSRPPPSDMTSSADMTTGGATGRSSVDRQVAAQGRDQVTCDHEHRQSDVSSGKEHRDQHQQHKSAITHHHHHQEKPGEQKKSEREDLKSEINELREFSDNFKLSDHAPKEKRDSKRGSDPNTAGAAPIAGGPPSAPETPPRNSVVPPGEDGQEQDLHDPEDDVSPSKKSTLNPNAREFRPQVISQSPVVSSPRQSQSPVIQQAIHMPHQHIFAAPAYMAGPLVSMAQPMMGPPPHHQSQLTKRAVVSVVRSDLPAAAQALAATGTPLQAQPAGMPGQPQYTLPFMVPQNLSHNMGAPIYNHPVLQVGPGNGHPRLMNAQNVMMSMNPGHQHLNPLSANVPQQQQQMFISSHGGLPGNVPPGAQGQGQGQPPQQQMAQAQQNHPHGPTHYAPHHSRATPPQSSHNPSPQQGAPPSQGQQAPPPPPQAHSQYHHNGQMGQSAQALQPSPHTPTSPQAQQPNMPIAYSFPQHIQAHSNNPAMHQMAINHMQMTPQVSYTAHHAHGPPPPQHNHVMMIQPHQAAHLQGAPPHHIQHAQQPGQPGPPQLQQQHMQGPVHISQSGHHMAGAPQPGMTPMNIPAGQIHYAPQQMIQQSHMRSYPQSQ